MEYKYKLFKKCNGFLYKLILKYLKWKFGDFYKKIENEATISFDDFYKKIENKIINSNNNSNNNSFTVSSYFEFNRIQKDHNSLLLPYIMKCWLFNNRIFFYDEIQIYQLFHPFYHKFNIFPYQQIRPETFIQLFFYENVFDDKHDIFIILCKNKRKNKVFVNSEKILDLMKDIKCNNINEFVIEFKYYYDINMYKLFEYKEGKVFVRDIHF